MKKILIITIIIATIILSGCGNNIATKDDYLKYIKENEIEKQIENLKQIEKEFTTLDYKDELEFIKEAKEKIVRTEEILKTLKESIQAFETTDEKISVINVNLEKYITLTTETVTLNKEIIATYETIKETGDEESIKKEYIEIIELINEGQTKSENAEAISDKVSIC